MENTQYCEKHSTGKPNYKRKKGKVKIGHHCVRNATSKLKTIYAVWKVEVPLSWDLFRWRLETSFSSIFQQAAWADISPTLHNKNYYNFSIITHLKHMRFCKSDSWTWKNIDHSANRTARHEWRHSKNNKNRYITGRNLISM